MRCSLEKLVIFSFTRKEAARDIVREFLIKEVIPAIMLKWPSSNQEDTIYIQQDNARTHVDLGDQAFQAVMSSSGYHIRLVRQPPNSRDLNILDLDFFSAIQSLQRKACPRIFE
ncbi:hypothetical protein LIER_04381 [Lithospermum erythrorhizon]|uniref:Transposase n=1 Tax=Lithospermum erythrorhizon TaxID=34254 RepID=A0AAV3NWP6_LITER